jgi:hypothetical protein
MDVSLTLLRSSLRSSLQSVLRFPFQSALRSSLRLVCVLAVVGCVSLKGWAVTWFPFGPNGGDARTFAADPTERGHLYLGTVNGWLYESHDGGESWKRLARMENRTDLALDNIVVDPTDAKHLLVGAWIIGQTGGGLFEDPGGGHAAGRVSVER